MKAKNLEFIYPLTVYFDGACKLCASEIDNIAARDIGQRLVLVDCNTPSFDYAALGTNRDAMLNEIHARATDGTWLRGVDVFIAMYQAVDLGVVANALAHPIVKPLAMRFYPWLVRNRYYLSQLGLHEVLGLFAHTARRKEASQLLRKRAESANVNSAACRNGTCQRAAEL